MPVIPKILPLREDSGCDRPLKAKINNNADNKYKIATVVLDII